MKDTMKRVVDFLYEIPKFTKKNSLDHTRMLMRKLGEPGKNCKVIHVAGSNGKGSVCSFLAHMLYAGEKTVGLFTSPHLTDIRERFRINGALCSEESFLDAFLRVKKAAHALQKKGLPHPAFFEFIFAMGMLIFEEAGVEYVILETGLGGRLDATNSFPTPILTVITSISLEHTEILGDTIAKIAAEKAGIIKPGVPVVYDANEPDAAGVISEYAQRNHCFSCAVTKKMCTNCEFKNNFIDFSLRSDYDKKTRWQIPFAASYQVQNAALAITAMRVLMNTCKDLTLTEEQMQTGMAHTVWQGRMQEVEPEIYFDGAHNTSGIGVFLQSAKQLTQKDKYPPLLLFSMVKEKDYHTSVDMLTHSMEWEQIAVSTIPNERGISFEKLQKLFESSENCPVLGYEDYREAFFAMRKKKKEGQKLFCTGSLYFIGALMEAMKEERND